MYTGPWIKLPKPPDSVARMPDGRPTVGLMHEDEAARARGFQGGLVGGLTVATMTTPALVASFGHVWYENGAYSVSFAKPVYHMEDVRVVWEEIEPDPGDKRKIAFSVERQNGERTTFGWAALGEPGGQGVTPPWERNPAPPLKPEDDLVPEMRVGTEQPPYDCRLTKEELITHVDMAHDDNWWYRIASPWGGPIIPPAVVAGMVRFRMIRRQEAQRDRGQRSRLRTVVDGGHELVVFEPLFVDRVYHVQSHVAEKGRTKRSFYLVIESTVNDSNGKRVCIVRSKASYFINEIVPA